jgi:uncharacterized protein (TIGR03067 family)
VENDTMRIPSLVSTAVALSALVAASFSAADACDPGRQRVYWDSPKVRQVEKEWYSLEEVYRTAPRKLPGENGKSKFGKLASMQDRLFRKRLSDTDLRRLVDSIDTQADRYFVDRLAAFMLTAFVYSGDRENLVRLLSSRCPADIRYYEDLEHYLTCERTRLKDPIVVLGEAFVNSRAPTVRHDLATAVRRAFLGTDVSGDDDADYVTNAMRWYRKEKDNVLVNRGGYFWTEMHYGALAYYDPRGRRPAEWAPLFVKKPVSAGPPNEKREAPNACFEPVSPGVRAASAKHASSVTAEEDFGRLQGTWEVVKAEFLGKPYPPEKIRGERYVIQGDTLTVIYARAKAEKRRVRLDPKQDPRAIDLLSIPEPSPQTVRNLSAIDKLIEELKEEMTSGIYELKGDSLQLCIPARGDWRRPTSFQADERWGDHLVTLRRLKGEGTGARSD